MQLAGKVGLGSLFVSIFGFLFVVVPCMSAQVPHSDHVVIMMVENHSYSQVVGNTNMPYLNSLINSSGLATNYDANSHYSIPNYFWITAGKYVTLNDGSQAVYNVDNVTRYLLGAGKTWKAYEESIPSAGYTGPTVEPYEKNHDPFVFFSDVVNSSQVMNVVPYTQLATDISNNQLPNYSFITPNSNHDGHTKNLATMDQWLSANLPTLLNSPYFQPGGDGILFITFDESLDTDCAPLTTCPSLPENGGGGHVATVVIGPNVKPGYKSSTFYQHPSVLKTGLVALGITTAPAAASTAPTMSDFFSATTSNTCVASTVNQTVTICTPQSGQTVSSPVQITALTTDSLPVKYIQVYIDGLKAYQTTGGTVNTSLALSSGSHRLTVQAYDGINFKSTIYITVQ